MTPLDQGVVTLFYLFDVAEAVDVDRVRRDIESASPTRVAPKPPTPAHIQYRRPPVTVEAAAVGVAAAEGWTLRFKLFDYGVVSVAMSRPLPHTWPELLEESLGWHDNAALAAQAETACRTLLDRVAAAVTRRRRQFLSEDYLVITLTNAGGAIAADALLREQGVTIAQMLRGEREALSTEERDEVLRHRLSYLASDLVVATWSAAFICDTEAGAQGVLEILEFANSQLLEFRYYDQLLDDELQRIYALLERPRWPQSWFGRRLTGAARHVHTLFVDVTEITDHAENVLKIVGDVYAARLFTLTAARLGLEQWKGNVRAKLRTLDDIYRFAVEQTAMARGELLELMIVLILVFELGLFFAGIMQ